MLLSQSRTVAVLFTLGSVVQAGWVDPDTPPGAQTIDSLIDGSVYNLVGLFLFNLSIALIS